MSDDFMQVAVDQWHDIGFTGARRGLESPQRHTIIELMQEIVAPERVHHGDCIGADAEFHYLVRLYWPDTPIVGHPPRETKYRAFCKFDTLLPTDDYLARNKKIVNTSTLLIATPDGPERKRSGTWSTLWYAHRRGVETMIVMPDGSML